MVLLAAFQTLLHRYAGQDDLLVGSPIANRTRTELEGLIGFFVNTLVLRARFAGDPTFRALLRQVRETALGAYAHQDLPFEKLVEELQPQRDLSRNPLFQVMFVYGDARVTFGLTSSVVQEMRALEPISKFDLTLFAAGRSGEASFTLEYNTDLFDPATIARFIGHFRTLLEGIVQDPDQRVATLPLLSASERRQLLVEWNDTAAAYPADRCIHELVEAQVARTPDAVAVVFEDEELTHRARNARANRLAHHPRALGRGTPEPPGVLVQRSLEMVVGILAILKAGGAYVPLDPEYPRERLAFMLEDAGVAVLLTQARLRERLPDHGARVELLEDDHADQPATDPTSGVRPDNLAYVIYTSGSTGRPKGVMSVHRGLTNRLHWMQGAYRLERADVWSVTHSFAFDFSVWELFGALFT